MSPLLSPYIRECVYDATEVLWEQQEQRSAAVNSEDKHSTTRRSRRAGTFRPFHAPLSPTLMISRQGIRHDIPFCFVLGSVSLGGVAVGCESDVDYCFEGWRRAKHPDRKPASRQATRERSEQNIVVRLVFALCEHAGTV